MGGFLLRAMVSYIYIMNKKKEVPIILQVASNNPDAVKWYKKHGFVEVVNSGNSVDLYEELAGYDWNNEAINQLKKDEKEIEFHSIANKEMKTFVLAPSNFKSLKPVTSEEDADKKKKEREALQESRKNKALHQKWDNEEAQAFQDISLAVLKKLQEIPKHEEFNFQIVCDHTDHVKYWQLLL